MIINLLEYIHLGIENKSWLHIFLNLLRCSCIIKRDLFWILDSQYENFQRLYLYFKFTQLQDCLQPLLKLFCSHLLIKIGNHQPSRCIIGNFTRRSLYYILNNCWWSYSYSEVWTIGELVHNFLKSRLAFVILPYLINKIRFKKYLCYDVGLLIEVVRLVLSIQQPHQREYVHPIPLPHFLRLNITISISIIHTWGRWHDHEIIGRAKSQLLVPTKHRYEWGFRIIEFYVQSGFSEAKI
jgi:hypothetical protein